MPLMLRDYTVVHFLVRCDNVARPALTGRALMSNAAGAWGKWRKSKKRVIKINDEIRSAVERQITTCAG